MFESSNKINKIQKQFFNESYSFSGGHTKGTKYVSPTFWRPGPVPRTPEEHKAAAEKYNLEPEDYRPHPNFNCDYPDMPVVALGNRDPFYPWDNYHIRRNHGEPVIISHDMANNMTSLND